MATKIAIFRALYLGDMLCSIPAVRAIRAAYPDAEIHLVGLPWQRDFVSRFDQYFNHFIEFPGWPGLPEQKPDSGKIIDFLHCMHRHRFDIVFQMQGNGIITNSLCMLWGAKTICGLRREGEYCPDVDLFPISEDGEHEILRFLKLTDALGIQRQGTQLEFPITQAESARFQRLINASGITLHDHVCLHPGARDARRRWPVEKFILIANELAAQGFTPVLTGSIAEKSLLKEIQKKTSGAALNIVESLGHLSAGELGCVLQHARLIVSNDTGVSHIAAALNVPSVILFSPYSDMQRWRPLNEENHFAIPHEKAGDADYVLKCIIGKLAEVPATQESSPLPDLQHSAILAKVSTLNFDSKRLNS